MLVRGRQNSKAISENCFKFEHLVGRKKKYTKCVMTSSHMTVLFEILDYHHSHNSYIQLIAQHHSLPNTEAPFKESGDQKLDSRAKKLTLLDCVGINFNWLACSFVQVVDHGKQHKTRFCSVLSTRVVCHQQRCL